MTTATHHRPPGPRHAAEDPWPATDRQFAQDAWYAEAPLEESAGPRHAAVHLPALSLSDRTAAEVAERDREVALFAAEVRRAIAAKGYTLRQLEASLDDYGPDFRSAYGTLSSWQSGTTTPPATEAGLNRVLALERCLDVPAGDLAKLIPGDLTPAVTRPLTQIGVHNRPARATLSDRHKQFQRIVNRLSGPQRTIPVATAKTFVLGWNYRPVQTIIRPRLRAAHDLVDRYWFLHAPTAHAHPTVNKIAGCKVGQIVHEDEVLPNTTAASDGGYKLVAVELLFDKVLTRGEPYEFTFSIGYAGTEVPREDLFRHIQVQPCQSLHLELQFQAQRPEQLQQCRWTGDLRLIEERPLKLDPQGTYQQDIPDPVPGAYGWTWTGAATSADA